MTKKTVSTKSSKEARPASTPRAGGVSVVKKTMGKKTTKKSGPGAKPVSAVGQAKKTPTKKTPTKKVPTKKVPAKKTPTKKTPTKKVPTKKVPTKKVPTKKVPTKKVPTKKTPTKKVPTKKTPTKKTPTKKVPTKKVTNKSEPVKKAHPKKVVAKTAPTKKPTTKKPPIKKRDKKSAGGESGRIHSVSGATVKPAAVGKGGAPTKADAGARKGITVVQKRSPRRPRTPPPSAFMMPVSALQGLKSAFGKPMIPSGPSAKGASGISSNEPGRGRSKKAAFTKRELTKFRKILETKRFELSSEVSQLEKETLGRNATNQPSKSQAVDDQGSEAADQALSLDLVAAERKLLSEIIEAIRRIDGGTYGLCEMTGRAINIERLEELPWTRYSIDAAREIERRSLGT